MGFRFHRGVRLLPGVRLNFSKSGTSLSLGGRGLSLNLSPSGVRTTVGVPGSGLSYRSPTYQWGSLAGGAKSGPGRGSTRPRGRKEKLRGLTFDPARYPQSDEECQRLASEQPPFWEWLLAYRWMTLRFTVLREDWERVTRGEETPPHPRGLRDALAWSDQQLKNLKSISDRVTDFGDERVIADAFGPPGVKGNPEKIGAWVDSVCGDLAACVDWERETQTLRWFREGGELLAAMNGWTLCVVKPFFEMLASLEKQLAVVAETKRLNVLVKLDEFDGERAVKVLREMRERVWVPFPEGGEARVETGGPGGVEPPRLEMGGGGGGGGGEEGAKVFFDDGQVRVTEFLVTIGPPWNKAFAVAEIRSVHCGENEGNKLQKSILRSFAWLFLAGGALLGVSGWWVGAIFGGITGLSLLLTQPSKEGPYGVTISMGGFWESEYLSCKSLEWAEAVAQAVQEAMAYRPGPARPGGEYIFPKPDQLRN